MTSVAPSADCTNASLVCVASRVELRKGITLLAAHTGPVDIPLLPPMSKPPRATIDFETRSECSLRECGSWRYSLDRTTDVLCLAFRLPHWATGRTGLWHPAFEELGIREGEHVDDLRDLFAWVMAGRLVEAHNAWFERGIWINQLPGWPTIRSHQWRDSAAKAAAHALPRKLAGAAHALGMNIAKDDSALRTALDLDDKTTRVMTKMSQPRKALKAERTEWGVLHAGCKPCVGTGKVDGINPETGRAKKQPCPRCKGLGYKGTVPAMPTLYHESRELMEELWAYCRQDVLAEEALSAELPDLSDEEQRIYQLDQDMNERGFQLDTEAVSAAITLIDGECQDLNAELRELTDGTVEKATQRQKMMTWLEGEGLKLYDTRKETLDDVFARGADGDSDDVPWALPPSQKARRALELMRALGRSSTAKYGKMVDWMCPDGRVRGGLLYHGATTGRWSGAGIQPHNFPKGSLRKELKGTTQDALWDVLKTRNAVQVRAQFGDVMEALSHGLRGAIVAAVGHQLYVADYAGIEARVVNWLAGNTEALDIFRSGADIYCYMADDIYGYTTNKHDHPKERGIGKIAVLGLGYQMGASKFVETCAAGGVTILEDNECIVCGRMASDHFKENRTHPHAPEDPDEITAYRIVQAYRAKFWRVKEMWKDQEETAVSVVLNDTRLKAGKVWWFMDGPFLYCELPSGRRLAYPEPEVRQVKTSWGAIKDQLTFMGVDTYTHQWRRQHTYGGSLVENITQAVARDLMADAFLRCEESDTYVPVLTVHDELIAEAKTGTGNVKEFETLMATCPPWARGLPVAAEGWTGVRYHK